MSWTKGKAEIFSKAWASDCKTLASLANIYKLPPGGGGKADARSIVSIRYSRVGESSRVGETSFWSVFINNGP